jgi:hypothetical protein
MSAHCLSSRPSSLSPTGRVRRPPAAGPVRAAPITGATVVGIATAWRYVEETVALLAAKAPKLRQAVRAAKKGRVRPCRPGRTLIPVGRVAADRPFYSG